MECQDILQKILEHTKPTTLVHARRVNKSFKTTCDLPHVCEQVYKHAWPQRHASIRKPNVFWKIELKRTHKLEEQLQRRRDQRSLQTTSLEKMKHLLNNTSFSVLIYAALVFETHTVDYLLTILVNSSLNPWYVRQYILKNLTTYITREYYTREHSSNGLPTPSFWHHILENEWSVEDSFFNDASDDPLWSLKAYFEMLQYNAAYAKKKLDLLKNVDAYNDRILQNYAHIFTISYWEFLEPTTIEEQGWIQDEPSVQSCEPCISCLRLGAVLCKYETDKDWQSIIDFVKVHEPHGIFRGAHRILSDAVKNMKQEES
jgi:hypothetical protein